MESSKSFMDIIVWQKAHKFVLDIYKQTKNFPKDEQFGITSQLRRAAVSIPANIAEGFKRTGKADKLKFYNIAQSSLEECRYYLILVHDLKLCDSTVLLSDLESVSKILSKYNQSLLNFVKQSNSAAA